MAYHKAAQVRGQFFDLVPKPRQEFHGLSVRGYCLLLFDALQSCSLTSWGDSMLNKILAATACTGLFALTGCMNMPTPTNQITGTYVSGLNYEEFDCQRLAVEGDTLARREAQLEAAQQQRIKSSQMQAFWWGFGQGDGMEASELSQVRGEKEAVNKAMAVKSCSAATATAATE